MAIAIQRDEATRNRAAFLNIVVGAPSKLAYSCVFCDKVDNRLINNTYFEKIITNVSLNSKNGDIIIMK